MRRGRLRIGCLMPPVLFMACILLILIGSTTFYLRRSPKSRVDDGESIRGKRPTDDAFENFGNRVESRHYRWTHLQYGRYRRRLVEPELTEVSRAIAAGHEASEIQLIVRRAANRLHNETGDLGYRAGDCVGGRLRFLPGYGVEYELYFRDRAANGTTSAVPTVTRAPYRASNSPSNTAATSDSNRAVNTAIFHTVQLHRQFGDFEVQYAGRKSNQLIHIILPYFHRPEALEAFLAQFVQLAEGAQRLALTVVRFSEGLPAMDEREEQKDREKAGALVAAAARTLGGMFVPPVTILEAAGHFSAGAAYLAATAATSGKDGIVMMAHVDLLFGERFLQRCQANAQPGRRVYYPMVFSAYKPHLAYEVLKKTVHKVQESYNSDLIHSDFGYWLDSDYSVSCQYLSDFRRFTQRLRSSVGRWLNGILYERYVKSDVEVIRMPDPDLVQVYHKVTCLKEMRKEEYNACLKAKAMNEASQLEWGLWVYKNLGDTDNVIRFLKTVEKHGVQLPTRSSLRTQMNDTRHGPIGLR